MLHICKGKQLVVDNNRIYDFVFLWLVFPAYIKCLYQKPLTKGSAFAQAANLLNEEIPQIFSLCGRGPRSTLRLLRPGLAVTEMAVSPLPGNPTAVWTIKRSMLDDFDAYIIVSFTNATLVRLQLLKSQTDVTNRLKSKTDMFA